MGMLKTRATGWNWRQITKHLSQNSVRSQVATNSMADATYYFHCNLKIKYICVCLAILELLFGSEIAHAALTVKLDAPKQVGKKVVIKLTMKNTFAEKIESARAQVFLLDENGSVTGQAARWVIGGTKEKPPLAAGAETTFNFVILADKPFATNKVTFTRIILEGGKVVDPNQNTSITGK